MNSGIWTESKRNYWVDSENKYGLELQARGNYSLKILDLRNGGRQIESVYLALKTEDEARAYMDFLLFSNDNADELVARLTKSNKDWLAGRAGHR